jgi:hypothetical protein
MYKGSEKVRNESSVNILKSIKADFSTPISNLIMEQSFNKVTLAWNQQR